MDKKKDHKQDEYDFYREVMKKKPLDKRKIAVTAAGVAAGAVLFGVIAAFVFVKAVPYFRPEEEQPRVNIVEGASMGGDEENTPQQEIPEEESGDAPTDENDTTDVDFADGAYTVTIANELLKGNAYTVTVEGAGYRTARHTVSMTGNKTLNFWNNVKDAPAFIEESVGTGVTTNFLAGDIVKDGQINIYDLSAVISYFGANNLVTDNPGYAKYDLNRDGVIDSKDVAYVLVSWGK